MSKVSNRPLVLPKGPKSQQQEKKLEEKQLEKPLKTESEEFKLTSTLQLSRPYLTKKQITLAQMKNIENQMIFDQRKNQIFQFMVRIAQSLKFPTRVLEIAMIYYQRYYLLNPFDTSSYYNTGLISLFMAIKSEETIKKLKDLIIASNQIRSIQMTPEAIETYKKKLLKLESKLLETISFDFRSYNTEEYIVKFCKKLKLSKDLAYLSWLIAFDSFQTFVGIIVPSHTIALASIYLSCKIKEEDIDILSYSKEFYCEEDAVYEAILQLLDIYINNYNYTGLVNFYPDLQNKFLEIKLPLADITKGLKEVTNYEISSDKYFTEARDFEEGERRYMLGNQQKRLYNEL